MTKNRLAQSIAVTAGAAMLSACGSSSTDPSTTDSARGSGATVTVVASTNVYGSIAEAIGGTDVKVTSILSDPAQDPHSFEANPRTALAVSRADVLIENGGGYDDYMDRLHERSSDATVVNVVELSGKEAPRGGELNEHMWYDLPTVKRLARDLSARFTKLDPEHAQAYSARAQEFTQQVDELTEREALLHAANNGTAIGVTEPVPLYLTEASGLVNKTPEEFSEAVEEGDDVSAAVLSETLDLYRDNRVQALFYNVQTSGPITEKVKAAAEAAGVAVVPVTETLPPKQDYLSWMSANIDALHKAVSR